MLLVVKDTYSLKIPALSSFFMSQEGAFANIILQNGFFGFLGYVLTFQLTCDTAGPYCVQYRNGTLHDVLSFELLICSSAVIGIVAYSRSLNLYWSERRGRVEESELKQYKRDSLSNYSQARRFSLSLMSQDPGVHVASGIDQG